MPPVHSSLSASVIAVAMLVSSQRIANADDVPMSPAAAVLWTEGQALYQEGRYLDAIERFERGRAIEPRPEFLYAQGQAARKAGDCRRAIELYRRFIIESNTPAQVEAARVQITRCETELVDAGGDQKPVVPESSTPTVPATPIAVAEHRPWYRDTLGLGLMATGAVALGTGTAFVVRSRRDLGAEQESYGQFERGLDGRQRDRVIGLALLGAAGAFTIGAVLRFSVWPARVDASATVIATPDGAAAAVRGTF